MAELHGRLRINSARILGHVVAIDRTRTGKRRETVEALRLFLLAIETDATHGRKLYFVLQLAIEAIHIGMIGGVFIIGKDKLAIDNFSIGKHILLLGDKLLPVVDTGLVDISNHHTTLGGTIVGKDIKTIALIVNGRILVIHIFGKLDKLAILLSQVAHKEVIACTSTCLIEIHHRFVIVDAAIIEAHRLCGVLIEEHIFALRGTDLVIINLMTRVNV